MRISILQGAFLPVPPLMGGAVEKIWFEMGKQFAARGHRVTQVSRCHADLPGEETIESVRHLRVKGHDTPRSLLKLKMLDLAYTLRALRVLPEADIVVTNTFWAPMILGRRHGKMVVSVQRMPKGQMRFYRQAPRWHAVSSAVQNAILDEEPDQADRIRVIPNPLPFTLGADELAQIQPKEKLILYAGRIHPEKGLDLLVEAFRLIHGHPSAAGWRLEMAGPWSISEGGGGEEYVNALLASATGLPVRLCGAVHDPVRLQALYRKAIVFVYPSIAEKGETFGVAPLEAMAYGAVPVVSDLACFKDFIRSGENGLFFDHRAKDAARLLSVMLAGLITDPQHCQQMAGQAIKVNESHAPGRIADMFLEDFAALSANQ